MRLHEITPIEGAPPSHPHVAVVHIDPADYFELERLIEERPELRLIRRLDDEPDQWTLHVGCASAQVREGIEDAWG